MPIWQTVLNTCVPLDTQLSVPNNLQWNGVVELFDDSSYSVAPLIITLYKEDGNVDPNNLQWNGVVELFDDSSYSVAPLIITLYKEDGNIDLHQSYLQHHPFLGVDPRIVHTCHIYGDGKKAVCEIGIFRKVHIIPCTEVSHSIMQSGSVSYQVYYLNEEEKTSVRWNSPLQKSNVSS